MALSNPLELEAFIAGCSKRFSIQAELNVEFPTLAQGKVKFPDRGCMISFQGAGERKPNDWSMFKRNNPQTVLAVLKDAYLGQYPDMFFQ